MDIAGGIYLETCETPHWSGLWGSGLRAAVAISSLAENVTLHSYLTEASNDLDRFFSRHKIKVALRFRHHAIAFSYFHPLSNPLIEPAVKKLTRESPIFVEAENILRFGFIEGSACVHGSYVAYDPQSPFSPENFFANGSTAAHLALVMNEQELKAYSGSDDLSAGVNWLLTAGEAQVVVVKRGIFGALVYEIDKEPKYIPVYQSRRIFKIGTGDVFSSVFAFFWAQEKLSAACAADLASRAVAVYCDHPSLPVDMAKFQDLKAFEEDRALSVEVYCTADTIGRRYTLEEALYCIRALGLHATEASGPLEAAGATKGIVSLIIADGFSERSIALLDASAQNILVLDEEHRLTPLSGGSVQITDDFTSSVYKICMKAPLP